MKVLDATFLIDYLNGVDATAEYLESITPPADGLVAEMEAQAAVEGIPIADRSVACLQAILCRATDAARTLEFGTAIGYSTLYVARTGADVVTTEVDRTRIDDAVDYLRRDGLDVRVTDDPATVDAEPSGEGNVVIVEGPALSTLPHLDGPFDLAFLDAVKAEYGDYLEGSMPMLTAGGVVVVDNLLRGGRVATADPNEDSSAGAVRAFNEAFVVHEGLRSIVTPLGDGTGIGVKIG